jgi:hypothetical protein
MTLPPIALQSLVTSAATLRLLATELTHVDASRAYALDQVADNLRSIVDQAQVEQDREDAYRQCEYQAILEREHRYTDQDLQAAGLPVG